MLVWLLIPLALIFMGLLLYWLLVTTEGVFLGQQMVVWLYDVTAHKYDAIKEYDPADEKLLVVRPVLKAVMNRPHPLILDVATGTGRVPYDLLKETAFQGRFIGLDASQRMLDMARQRLAPFRQRVDLVRHPAVPLPFPDNSFDATTCLEALEFFPSDEAALREMVRVLRPGGWLLTTRRCDYEGKLFLNRYRSQESMENLLREMGLEAVSTTLWEINYNLVQARKPSR